MNLRRAASPLARRLVTLTVAFSTLVALIATAIQLYLDYQRDLGQIETTFRQIGQTNVPTLANALWATNRHELQVALDGLVRLPDVRYAEVREGREVWGRAGTDKTVSVKRRDFPLAYSHRGRLTEIGSLTVVIDLEGVYQRLWEKAWVILITNGIKTFFVAGFMLWLFHWLVTRHLRRIAEFAARLRRDNLDEKLTLERPTRSPHHMDEFDDILQGFTRMQGNLAQAMHTLAQDIDKLARAEKEIQQLNMDLEQRVEERTAQLEAVNQELESFSYSVSHDLRAPLRSIDGFSQALLEDYGDRLDHEGVDHLRRVRRAAQRMGSLIDDILRLARVTRTDMTPRAIDLSALAHEVIEDLHKHKWSARAKPVVQPGLMTYGDAALVRVVLENLIDNAWKYSSKAPVSKIEIGSTRQNGLQVFFVRDNGVGFDMAFVSKLFGAFQRLHTEQEFPGTGIGLTTVQRIVHRHGGRVWAESAPGAGATFYFTFGTSRVAAYQPMEAPVE